MMPLPMTKLPHVLLAAALVAGCNSSDPQPASQEPARPGSTQASPSPSGVATAQPGAVAAPAQTANAAVTPTPEAGPPICSRAGEKAWGSGANKLTGLTTKGSKEDLAIGFAFGTTPRVLVIEKTGEAKIYKVKTDARTKAPDPKEGTRALMRVSPIAIEGETARAFLDFRDEYKDKRRNVVCGPADSGESFLSFEGTSYLDMDPKPTGEDKKKLFSWKKGGGYVELRDCRTFVTKASNEIWALGSVLRGTEKEDGTNEWKMVFLVDFGKGDEEIVLHETPLKGDPPKLVTYEIPTSRRVEDRGYVVATRLGGSLMVGVLDASRKVKGKFKAYKGFPSMPDFGRTDDSYILTTGVGAGKERSLKALVISKETLELPAGYIDVPLEAMDAGGDAETSFTAPELTVDKKGQRWLTYIDGPRDKGHLRIAPLDKNLRPMGRAFSITEGEVFASEGRLVSLDDGRLMVAYIRDSGGKVELVTEQLSCDVKK
jgi:hypothetical protein